MEKEEKREKGEKKEKGEKEKGRRRRGRGRRGEEAYFLFRQPASASELPLPSESAQVDSVLLSAFPGLLLCFTSVLT